MTGAARRALAVLAALFGLATLVAGGRTLLGADPGYAVYAPLLIFNTAMGAAYLVAAVAAWRDARQGARAAAAVFAFNVMALAAISIVHLRGGGVASESLAAMSFRAGVWLVLWIALAILGRRREALA